MNDVTSTALHSLHEGSFDVCRLFLVGQPGMALAASPVPGVRPSGVIPMMSRRDDTTTPQGESTAAAGANVQGAAVVWRAVDRDLSAVVGRLGTAAVLRRALVLTRRTHGWLPEPSDDARLDECVQALALALAGRRPAESDAGLDALEATFQELLSSLVGDALSTQLLRAAWAARRARAGPTP